jgi:hypothetical protein
MKISQHHMYLQNVTVQAVHIEKEHVLPTLNCRTWWETAHTILQHSTWVNVYTYPFCTFVCLQLVWNKNKELFFAGSNAIFPGLNNRQTCFTLDTKRRYLQTARLASKVPDQHLTSQSHCNSEHSYSCRQRVVYVGWSTWTMWYSPKSAIFKYPLHMHWLDHDCQQ